MDLKRKLPNEMTLYRVTGHEGSGKPIVSSPELMRVRYAGTNELVYTNPGEEVYQKALIISDTELTQGDLVIDGNHTDITDPVLADADEVKRATKVPSLKADYNLFIFHV